LLIYGPFKIDSVELFTVGDVILVKDCTISHYNKFTLNIGANSMIFKNNDQKEAAKLLEWSKRKDRKSNLIDLSFSYIC